MGNCCRLLSKSSGSKKYQDGEDESENNYDVSSSPGRVSKKSSSRKKSSVTSSKKGSNGNVHATARINLSDTSLNAHHRIKTSISGSKNRLIESGNTLNTVGLTNAVGPAGGVLRATLSYENRLDENIPHIADFFAEDDSTVPTDNPKIQTLFLPRAKANMAKLQENQKKHLNESSFFHNSSDSNLNVVKRHNSCSTIFVDDSTVSQPNLKSAIRLVACAIYCLIQTRTSDNTMEIFDEKLYPISKDNVVPDDYDKIVPDQRYIYKFMKNLFVRAQLTAECAIVTLVYLERVLVYGELDLCPSSWKRLLLGAIILASKVWDDQAVWNVDFCQILQDINVENMNELERQYLNLVQFNTNVPSSVYAKYYFDLRQLAELYNLSFPHKQLTKEKALKLEAMSSVCQEKYKNLIEMQIKNARRTASTDNLYSPSRKSLVIIS